MDTDVWVREFQDAKQLADEVMASIQDRNTKYQSGSSEASRVTAAARRKLGSLATRIQSLVDLLSSSECRNLTESERNRRHDLLGVLRSRHEQMTRMLSRHQADRDQLLTNPGSTGRGPAPETDRTAELENHGIVQLQQQVMQDQDSELDELSGHIHTTRNIAITINEELDLHNRLLDDLDDDVQVTHSRLRAARRRLTHVLKKSNNCKYFCTLTALIAILLFVLGISFKIFHIFT